MARTLDDISAQIERLETMVAQLLAERGAAPPSPIELPVQFGSYRDRKNAALAHRAALDAQALRRQARKQQQ